MKKIIIAVILCIGVIACSKKDDGPESPIKNIEIPQSSADSPVKAGETVTIKGEGFTQSSEIWLRASATTKGATDEVKATVTAVTATGISFIVPSVSGKNDVVLKQSGQEFVLGTMYFDNSIPTDVITQITSGPIEGTENVHALKLVTWDDDGNTHVLATTPYNNGFTLTLPATVDISQFGVRFFDDEIPEGVTMSDENVKIVGVGIYAFDREDEEIGYIVLYVEDESDGIPKIETDIIYADRDVTIIGSDEYEAISVSLKKGWNKMYEINDRLYTTAPQSGLKWYFEEW
jgi:hypothetical protein